MNTRLQKENSWNSRRPSLLEAANMDVEPAILLFNRWSQLVMHQDDHGRSCHSQ